MIGCGVWGVGRGEKGGTCSDKKGAFMGGVNDRVCHIERTVILSRCVC